jgi:hypothetical protein
MTRTLADFTLTLSELTGRPNDISEVKTFFQIRLKEILSGFSISTEGIASPRYRKFGILCMHQLCAAWRDQVCVTQQNH